MHNSIDVQRTAATTSEAHAKFSPDKCWFCSKVEAKKPEFHFKVPMYRKGKQIGTEKNASGRNIEKYEWNSVRFPVPRCEDCEQTHNLRHWANSGPTFLTLVAVVGVLGWQLKDYSPTMDLIPVFVTVAYSVCALLFAMAMSRFLLSRMDAKVPNETYARNYPVLDKLIYDGWIIGEHKATGDDEGQALSKTSRV